MKSKINLEIEGGVCDDLVAWSVDLDEAFGEPYRAVVTTVSDKVRTPDALRADALGCHAKLTLEQFFDDGVIRRFLGGIVTSVCHEGSASLHPAWLATSGQERSRGSVYTLVIEPSIVRLREARRTEDYPDTTPLKAIQAVLARNGITPVVEKTRVEEEPYSGQVRFVQADETDWDFLHRILARYGLTYAFSHDADGNELLVLTEGRDFPVASALDFSDLPACDDTVRLRFSCTRHEAGTYPLQSFAARRGIVAGGRRTSFLLPLAPTGVSASCEPSPVGGGWYGVSSPAGYDLTADPATVDADVRRAAAAVEARKSVAADDWRGTTSVLTAMPGRILTIDGFLDASGEADESVTVRVTRARLEMRVGDRRGDESVCDVSFEAMEHSADSSRRWVAAEPAPVAKRLVFETYVCDRAGRWNDPDSVNTLVPSPQSFPETPWAFLVANPCLFRGEADDETADGHAPSPVMNVGLTQPLGGPHQGLYRFPRVGERVIVADLGDRLVLAGYVPDRTNSFGDFPAAGDVWTRQGELMRYRPPAGCERQPGETDEIGFSAYADAVEELSHRITDGSCVDFLIGVASAANHLQMLNAVRNDDAPRIESARARYLENPGKESVQAITVLAQELAAKYPTDGAARTILNLRASGTLVQRGDRGIDISTPGALNINAGEIFINGRRAVILQSDGKVQEAVGASSATVNPNGVALRSRRVIDAAGEFDSQVIVDAADGVTATGANVRLDGLFGAELSDAVGGSVRAANGALLVAGGTIDVATVTRPALVKAFGRVSQRSGLENVNETLEKWQEGRTPDGRPRSIADRGVGATGLVNRPMPQNGGGAGHFRGTAAGVVRTGGSASDLDLVAVSDAERTGGASDRYNGKDANLTVTKRELLRAETFARQVDTHRQAVESVIATSVDGKASSVTLRGHQLDVNVQVLSDLSATHLSDDCSTGGACG